MIRSRLISSALMLLLSLMLYLPHNSVLAAETKLVETFQTPLSKEWFWGLGTWTAQGGVLRGYESGPRRHGPVKLRRFEFGDGVVEFDFRLERSADAAGIIFNGSQERGHLVHVLLTRKEIRILAHAKKGESTDLLREQITLPEQDWHPVKIVFQGPKVKVNFNGNTWTVKHPTISELKQNFGFGGNSGGPKGEKAGAIEFRNLKIQTLIMNPEPE
ncbi:family 16 glycoside hydrolase [Gimesia algae]|uniref:3-keto-alpha-glucoside-1,2-lyase/3-keto-2-hydroxy-glucal hydratase domain-containing protein n=1 Tax=Gimesia algae TaxID=2527971 RepID=A0A517VF77_9PLAN|nr:family 16 glycoside hydrolase [Gimesia algae]QDT91651.1 hypothetical protein Pan161_33130 [Gimesia algae]